MFVYLISSLCMVQRTMPFLGLIFVSFFLSFHIKQASEHYSVSFCIGMDKREKGKKGLTFSSRTNGGSSLMEKCSGVGRTNSLFFSSLLPPTFFSQHFHTPKNIIKNGKSTTNQMFYYFFRVVRSTDNNNRVYVESYKNRNYHRKYGS